LQIVFTFKKRFYICTNKKTNLKKNVMKKSDFAIIAIGSLLFAATIAAATYFILTNGVAANIGVTI
jgi:spore coat polysaccharide biosynthesis predicted glycosyltransferase SpsG